jgi:hypothetical protein
MMTGGERPGLIAAGQRLTYRRLTYKSVYELGFPVRAACGQESASQEPGVT